MSLLSAPATPDARRPGRGASGLSRGVVHVVHGHRRVDALQSGGRRHGEGASRPRDRRAWRLDGAGDRRDRDPIQAAQPQPRSGGLVAPCAGRQIALRRLGPRSAGGATWHRVGVGPGWPRAQRRRPRSWVGARGRNRAGLSRVGDHDGHVPERLCVHVGPEQRPAGRAGNRRRGIWRSRSRVLASGGAG